MIELPRAALKAGEIAHPRFFSFGARSDLTQTTLGIAAMIVAVVIEDYKRKGIFEQDPFISLR